MSKEQYVSFKVAQLLKDKGFDWDCYGSYNLVEQALDECSVTVISHTNKNSTLGEFWISAPTQQMACDWVEKTYGFFIEVSRHIDINGNYHYFYMILDKECKYASSGTHDNNYPSKYEAIESALEYVLTNII